MTRLIDADALREALKSNCKPELCHDYNTAWCEHCCRTNDFEDLIDDAPTVDINTPKPGYWIYHPDYNGNPYALEYECSACAHRVSRTTNYCPNCGKELKGVRRNK